MTDLVGELRARRLVMELDPIRRPGAGRPTRPISLDGEPWIVVGAHIDTDTLEFKVATVGGREISSESIPVDLRAKGFDEASGIIQEHLRSQLANLPTDRELVAVEFGVPGYIAHDRGSVGLSSALEWQDAPLGTMIEDTLTESGLSGVHVSLSKDSHLAALHATRIELGLPRDAMAIYLGGDRDTGAGIIVDGEIFRGANGGAGDLGQQTVDPNGGRLEDYVGLRTLLVDGGLLGTEDANTLVNDDPRRATDMLSEAAAAGDTKVLEALERAGDALGVVIDNLLGLINPHAAILGGYLGVISPYLMPPIQRRIENRLSIAAFAATTIVALEESQPRVVAGAVLAARDACLYDPLGLTRSVA